MARGTLKSNQPSEKTACGPPKPQKEDYLRKTTCMSLSNWPGKFQTNVNCGDNFRGKVTFGGDLRRNSERSMSAERVSEKGKCREEHAG